MRRLCIAVVALAFVLVLPATGAAEEQPGPPRELWSAYPLGPKSRVATARPSRPLIPPVVADRTATDTQSGWLLALAVATAGVIVLLLATRVVAPVMPTVRMPSRPRARLRTRPRPRRTEQHTQYAPLRVAPEPAPRESVPYVTRRSGLVRSRYVVMVEEEGRTRELRRSRAFWQVGREAWQRRIAEDAWDGLANELRAEGWEVDTTGRYEYFVPLRRAIVSTLEPYTRYGRKGAPGR